VSGEAIKMASEAPEAKKLATLSLAALGVVYGDIGTSPLYAIRECFHGAYGIEPRPENVLGVLSLILWSLLVVVTLKYLTFILRADNQGEGGVLALTALVQPNLGRRRAQRGVLIALGLFAAALLYGDGMITPAISVLSAVEGIRIVTPVLEPYVIPLTLVILAGLFLFQKRGTASVGALFGPVTLVWFAVIGALGITSIASAPRALVSVNPVYGIQFLLDNRMHGFLVLGAVFLVVTGAEALYADMGHFGRKPIRLAWFAVVLPALICSYLGQGALLLQHPEQAHHPFYAMAPSWALVPLVVLATVATVIASQAVISGAFSLTRQAIQLGYLPRMTIVHTSEAEIGQVYVPEVNYFLMISVAALVLGFQTSSQLAAAYGVAVTTTMVFSSILFYRLARERWKWRLSSTVALVSLFLVVDLAFFGANISKLLHGAWFPLVVAGIIFAAMTTWKAGRAVLAEKLYEACPPLETFIEGIARESPTRVPGKAVFLAGTLGSTPPALLRNAQFNHVVHAEVAVLTVETVDVPHVPREEKVKLVDMGQGFHQIRARYGFMEEPNVPHVLALAREKGLGFELEETVFFLGRERIRPSRHPVIATWRELLYELMSRNALSATAYFGIPPEQVVEIGAHVRM